MCLHNIRVLKVKESVMAIVVSVYDWLGQRVDDMELSENIFAAPVRTDILSRVVNWQLAKRRSGNHKTKGISDISGTTRKPYKQKGTGRARQGSLRSPQFRGGAVIFGPVVRDHGYSIQKKVRKLGMKSALSSRFADGKLKIISDFEGVSGKTKDVFKVVQKSTLMISGATACEKLKRAIANLHEIDFLPQHGINVYDILRHDNLLLSREAVDYLEKWLAA